MKNTAHSTDIMYARLKNVHKLSLTGLNETERMDENDYGFFHNLWLVCESMEEWDKLVRKYKEINGYEI